MGNVRQRRTPLAVVTVLFAIIALVTSCSQESSYAASVQSDLSFDDVAGPDVTVTEWAGKALTEGATDVQPGAPITVQASEGVLQEVRVAKNSGGLLAGDLSEDGTTWVSSEPLGYGQPYTLEADAIGVGGSTQQVVSFTTRSPNNLTSPYLTPGKGDTVGIGQPVAIKFDEAIPDRKAAQDAISIRTEPAVEGAFYWLSDSEVRWRPQEYWEPGTEVQVDINTYGIDLGDGLFGERNISSNFTIGRSMIATADDNTKTVTIERDGEVIKSMPTSMGKPGNETPNGIYIVAEMLDHMIMDSSTYGVPTDAPDGYRTPVDYATRMSYSGIFFHAAPWSMWAQGNTNTSHGCLNLSPQDALWIQQNMLRGDPAIVQNTQGETLSGTDGLGDWNVPWETWSAGNA